MEHGPLPVDLLRCSPQMRPLAVNTCFHFRGAAAMRDISAVRSGCSARVRIRGKIDGVGGKPTDGGAALGIRILR